MGWGAGARIRKGGGAILGLPSNKDDVRLEPLRAILEAVVESRRRIDSLTGVLERGVWRLATDA